MEVAAGGRRGIENHADSTEAPSASVSCPYPSSSVAVGGDAAEAAVDRGSGGVGDHGAVAVGYGDGVVAGGGGGGAAAACVAGEADEEKEA